MQYPSFDPIAAKGGGAIVQDWQSVCWPLGFVFCLFAGNPILTH